MSASRKLGAAVFVGIILSVSAWKVWADIESTNVQLDSDFAEVEIMLEDARRDAAQYSSGIILVQIQLRQATLKSTKAMLLQKKKSWLRNISLAFTVEGEEVLPWSVDQIAEIEDEITATTQTIASSQAESDLYRGGLIKNLIELRVATERQTLALLKQKQITAKYGIVPQFGPAEGIGSNEPTDSVVDPAADQDAL